MRIHVQDKLAVGGRSREQAGTRGSRRVDAPGVQPALGAARGLSQLAVAVEWTCEGEPGPHRPALITLPV